MSDLTEAEKPQTTPEMTKRDLSPKSSPSPDNTIESELKLSRKREREVSVEPVTTPSATNDTDPTPRGRKDTAVPLKKNRRRLDPTEEEEDFAGSGSGSGSPPTPPTLASPRQEMKRKVRQISRGVEDINWKNMNPPTSEKEFDVDADIDFVAPELTSEEHADRVAHQQSVDQDIEVEDEDSPPKTPEDSALSRSVQDVQSQDTTMQSAVASPEASNRLSTGSESNDKGLKRKFLERGTSHGPPENGESSPNPPEALKRPRDESATDDNPRETKRPTPPPSPPRASPPSPKVPKKSGFMAYASNNSPFAAVKGQNIFMSGKGSSTPPASSSPAPSTLSTPAAKVAPILGQTSFSAAEPAPAATPAKRTGFEAFASSSSPFATAAARAKSPALGSASKLGRALSPPRKMSNLNANHNPFASYAGPSQGFALPVPKKARAVSPDGSARSSLERTGAGSAGVFGGSGESGKGSESGDEDEQDEEPTTTFGERLRAGKDDEDDSKWDDDNKIQLTEQDIMTGEEEEETLHQVRGKLFSLDGQTWRERGTGLLKVNVKAIDGTGARLLMRKDAVQSLLLNITLFPGMSCTLAQDPRYLRFSAIENGAMATYNLKLSNAKMASELLEEIKANIPT